MKQDFPLIQEVMIFVNWTTPSITPSIDKVQGLIASRHSKVCRITSKKSSRSPKAPPIAIVSAAMAQPLRRPLFSAVRFSSSFQQRCFSQQPSRLNLSTKPVVQRPRQTPDKSIRVMAKEQAMIPSDLGILDGSHTPPSPFLFLAMAL